MKNRIVASLAVAVAVMVMLSLAMAASAISIDSSVIGSGGGAMSGGSYSLKGTVGQAAVGTSSGGSYTLESGFWHTVGSSPTEPPEEVARLTDAKSRADGTRVHATGKIATTDASNFPTFFYVEEPDRSSGIRVVPSSVTGTLVRGATIEITGTMATTGAGERYILAAVRVSGTPEELAPLGMTNKTVGGSTLGTPPQGQYGVPDGSGTNNVGLLVKVWGEVKESNAGYIVIDDGSGVLLTVDTLDAPTIPTSGYVTVTGISSLYGSAGTAERLILGIAPPATPGNIMIDFESPEYALGGLNGQNNWVAVYPDRWQVQSTYALAGSQSFRTYLDGDGFYALPAGTIMADGTTLSMITQSDETDQGFMFWNMQVQSNPGQYAATYCGIHLHATGNVKFADNKTGINGWTDTAYNIIVGHVYKLTMTLDFTNQKYSISVNDLTTPGSSFSKADISFQAACSAASASAGQIYMGGRQSYFDNIISFSE